MSRPVNRRSVKAEYIETVGKQASKRQSQAHSLRFSHLISSLLVIMDTNTRQDTGNKISRKAHIEGKPNIMLGGRTVIMAGVIMRGDLQRKPERSGEGGVDISERTATTAITIGR